MDSNVAVDYQPQLLARRFWCSVAVGVAVVILAGCGGRPELPPTRTPVPTYTPTPEGFQPAAVAVAPAAAEATPIPPDTPTPTSMPEPATATPTPEPPTDTPTPLPPTETPTVTATPTPSPTITPTPTPNYTFDLETSEQFPAQDVDEVRIYLYVYSEDNYALQDYSLRVVKDGEPLQVQARSTAGLPGETRPGPSPYTRFANMGAAFYEPPLGVWEVQLVDPDGVPVGPPVTFTLGESDPLRELYVRYRRK